MDSRNKTRKQRASRAEGRPEKSCCGTLQYLAECRGLIRKIPPAVWKRQVDGENRIGRKYTTAG